MFKDISKNEKHRVRLWLTWNPYGSKRIQTNHSCTAHPFESTLHLIDDLRIYPKKMKSVLSTPRSSEITKFRRPKYLFRSLAPNSSTLLASIELESTRRLTRASKLLSATWTSSTVLCGAAWAWPSLQGPQHSQPSWRLWSGLYRQKSAPITTPPSYRSRGGPAARGASCDCPLSPAPTNINNIIFNRT